MRLLPIHLVVLLAACGGQPRGAEDTSTSGEEVGASGEASGEASIEGGTESTGTPGERSYTQCSAMPAAPCDECGLTVQLRRTRAWSAGTYEFEITSESNHIRCSVELPCTSTEPVACQTAPGAPQVHVITEGCGGPVAQQRLVGLRFGDACPAELRVEAFRAGAGAGNEAFEPRYTDRDACGGTCSQARATLTYRR